ncbi:hypothetical protein B0H11DRAFT_15389 [Mycena galericulata]|nr:hypothetical protein B0H11DRAFT_15389 [Mycena galericulata]
MSPTTSFRAQSSSSVTRRLNSIVASRTVPSTGEGISAYRYYLIGAIITVTIAATVLWASRRSSQRNEPPQKPVATIQPRPRFFDAYLITHEAEPGTANEWDWEDLMPLSVAAIGGASISLQDQPDPHAQDEISPPAHAEVAILLRMPGPSGDDLPYLEVGTLELDLLKSPRPQS